MSVDQFLSENHILYRMNEPMCRHTTFRIGGTADYYVTPANERELVHSLDYFYTSGVPFFVCGNLSNVVFSDNTYHGVVLDTRALNILHADGARLSCGAGATLTSAAKYALDKKLSGFEFAYGIPGTLGGGVYMNAGAYGGQMADVVSSVKIYDYTKQEYLTLCREDCAFAYRSSIFMQTNALILSCELSLCHADAECIRMAMEEHMNARKAKQPLEYPSAGSVFKRPQGVYVGQMVEMLGLKGMRVGGAMVSEKHAGFIINVGDATCRDLENLIDIIKEKVYEAYGISLECEICFVR